MIEFMDLKHSLLEKYHFPRSEIKELVTRFRRGEFTPEDNIISGSLEAPSPDNFPPLPEKDSPLYKKLYSKGKRALDNGQLGIAVLNGGMATRFGGVVKGVVEVFDSKSFLELKLRNAFKASGKVKCYIMNSFSTEEKTVNHFKKNNYFERKDNIKFFNQFIAPRITPEGNFYKGGSSADSFYGPGHGDFPYAFRESGCLDDFISSGGKHIFFSNVDNLGAKIDPLILGMHIESGKDLNAEVAPKNPGDEGGAPALVNGHLQLVEGFSFPPDFDQSLIPVFNCNSYWIKAESFKKSFSLPWYIVKKEIDGEEVIQFEHICGDLTRFLESGFIKVPRDQRFLPVKRPRDLTSKIEKLREAALS